MKSEAAWILLTSLLTVMGIGTVLFRWLEGWSWVDSYFFTVVTLSTVGYGNLVPQTDAGKIATTVFIFVGLGIFAAAIQQITRATLLRRQRRREREREAAARARTE